MCVLLSLIKQEISPKRIIFRFGVVEKTSREIRYDLISNQISYHYTMEVMNRFKGLDLVDRVPEELWIEIHNTV